jgi:oligopeptide transport system substrate-binding protein
MITKRVLLGTLLAVLVVGGCWALGACGGDHVGGAASQIGLGESPVDGGTFKIALPADPDSIDALDLREQLGLEIGDCLFDSLTKFDYKTGELLPAVAESWSVNDDATVWTFHLRKGTTFHDGSPVTAADFKYAWERICTPVNESTISYHLAAVKGYDAIQDGSTTELEGVKALDANTLEVTLSHGFGDFEYVVGHPALAPESKAAVESNPDYSQMPIGNGPFMMAEPWAHDQYIKLLRFDDYYGGAAHADGAEFLIFPDEDTAYREFEAGNLDFVSVPSAQIAAARTEYGVSDDGLEVAPGKQFLDGPESSTLNMCCNCTDSLMSSEALRQALSLGIDRENIAATVFGGTRLPATGIIPQGVAGYEPDQWQYCRFDREAAKGKLTEAGYPEGAGLPEVTLTYISGVGQEDLVAMIQSDWEAIGVQTKLRGLTVPEYFEALDTRDFQLTFLSWGADYPIMYAFLYPLFASDSADNYSSYNDSAVDQALTEAPAITDTAKRTAAYQEIERTVGEASPMIPIVTDAHRQVGSDRVRGLVYSPQTLFNLDQAWIAE